MFTAITIVDAPMVPTLTGPFDTGKLPRIAGEPVTVTVARRVEPGYEAEFLRWADQMVAAVQHAPGCLGAAVFHPGPDGGDYQIVVRFVDGLLLRQWERSAERDELMARAERFVITSRVHRTVGVEEWFEAGAHVVPKRPWWGRLFIDVAWVYPVSMLSALFVAPHLGNWPIGARVLVGAGLITLAIQAVVSPLRKKLRARRRL